MIDSLIKLTNSMGDRWFTWVLGSLLDTSVLLMLIVVVWVFFRRRVAPQVGYCLFLLVPMKLLLPLNVAAPAAISRWTPSAMVSTWFANNRNRGHVESLSQVERQEMLVAPRESSPLASTSPQEIAESSSLIATSAPDSIDLNESSRPIHLQTPQAAEPIAIVATPIPSTAPSLNIMATAMLAWLLAVTFQLGRVTFIQVRFRKRIERLETVDESNLGLNLPELCRRMHVTRTVRVVVSDDISAPAVWGVLQPTIILPRSVTATLTSRQLQWVLLHELAHIQRLDLLVVASQRLAAVLHFFNPAVWLANRMIHRLREYACDDLALSLSDGTAVDSGEAFLLILRQASQKGFLLNGSLGVFGLDSRAACFARVRRLMDTDRSIHIRVDRVSWCGLILLAAIALPHLRAAQNANDPALGQQPKKPAGTGASANSDSPATDKPTAIASATLAKDAGEFELSVVGSEGKPIPQAVVEFRSDSSPTAEEIRQGKFVRKGNYGVFVAADGEGRVVIKWPQDPGKNFLIRIDTPGYQTHWESWVSQKDEAPVPAHATIQLIVEPIAEGLAHRDGGKQLLGEQGTGVFFVAANGAVRKEIGIDAATAVKVQNLARQYCDVLAAAQDPSQLRQTDGFRDLSPEDQNKKIEDFRENRENAAEEAREKFVPKLKATLTSEQFERLQQIARQAYGCEPLENDRELAKALDLKQDQIEQITNLRREYESKQYELMNTGDLFAKYLELDKEQYGKAMEVLTKEQQEKLAKIEGRQFDLSLLTSPTLRPQFGWYGGRIIFMTAGNYAVQKDLGLSEEAATKVGELIRQFKEARFGLSGGFVLQRVRVSQDSVREFIDVELPPWDFGQWKALMATFLPRLKDILTADQFIRMQQIDWQARGTAAYWDFEVTQALAITKEQLEKITSITDEYLVTRRQLVDQANRSGENRSELKDKLGELIKEQDSRIYGTLMKTQLDTFALMKGKEFDLDQVRILQPFPRPEARRTRPAIAGAAANRLPLGMGGPTPLIVPSGGIFSVVNNEAVQRELGLSKDEVAKALEVMEQFNKTWRDAGGGLRPRVIRLADGNQFAFQEAALPPQGIRPFQGQSQEQRAQELLRMRELWKTTTAKLEPRLKEVMTRDQYSRLQQINWQALGTTAFYSESHVIDALGISKEQQVTITSITDEYRAKGQELFQKSREDRTDPRVKMSELTEERDTKINAVLTKDQLDKFALLKGKEFDASLLRDAERVRLPSRVNGGEIGNEAERPK